jgi:hypothetical protein
MAQKPQCPFCLREFATVEQLTQHLIFDNCQVTVSAAPEAEDTPTDTTPEPAHPEKLAE